MYSWVTLNHLVQWTGANPEGPWSDIPVKVISTDSRNIKSSEVFIALKGDKMDGHDYIQEAVSRGAGAVISEKPFRSGVPVLKVEDTLKALVSIGEALRNRFSGKVFAVTGSAGKSSTKDMIAALLGEKTVKSPASFNNLMGVSRTLYLVQDDSENLVLEMGMNALGEIAELCRHFRPQAGLITNIGDAHIGKLGGKEWIYRAKKELFDWLAQNPETFGVAVNCDDPLVQRAHAEAFSGKSIPWLRYSTKGSPADVCILSKHLDPESCGLHLQLKVKGTTFQKVLPLFGLHHAENVAAAISGALLLGKSVQDVEQALERVRPAPHRGEITRLSNDAILIDESYNSNPAALTSSLSSLASLSTERRRVFVIGDMRELGEFSQGLHREVGETLAALFRNERFVLVAVGKDVQALVQSVRPRCPHAQCLIVPDAKSALDAVNSIRAPGDIYFVKASRGIGLEKVVEGLK